MIIHRIILAALCWVSLSLPLQADGVQNNTPQLTLPLSAAHGGTGNAGTAWTAYTPTVTAWPTGAFTTVSATGSYQTVGKLTCVSISVVVTTAGTAAGFNVTLPNTTAAWTSILGFDESTIVQFQGVTPSGAGPALFAYTPAGAAQTVVSGHTYLLNGCYQNA